MTKQTYLVALCKIGGGGNPANVVHEATGEFNPDGTPKMKRIAENVLPGQIFPAEWLCSDDLNRFLASEIPVVRWATDAETAIVERQQRAEGV